MALTDFSKTFEIQEVKKGFFPHKFNKPSNFDYIGPYPEKEYYGYNYFNEKKRIEFDTFYESEKTMF